MSREARRVFFIASELNGTDRSLTPVASKTAFAKAAATGAEAASPAPYAGWSGWLIRATSIFGASENRRIG